MQKLGNPAGCCCGCGWPDKGPILAKFTWSQTDGTDFCNTGIIDNGLSITTTTTTQCPVGTTYTTPINWDGTTLKNPGWVLIGRDFGTVVYPMFPASNSSGYVSLYFQISLDAKCNALVNIFRWQDSFGPPPPQAGGPFPGLPLTLAMKPSGATSATGTATFKYPWTLGVLRSTSLRIDLTW